ncbi:aldehyde dehydrogenase family protein, partial [Zhongshania sp.]|uniref:aldehyde dehydrogenase family protein n=1 Tax=Zhongshania sp. TaxID=1971902 RepID=UPI0035687148
KTVVKQRYPNLSTADYTSIIDDKAYQRLNKTLEDATSKGARAVNLIDQTTNNDALRKLAPHLVCDVNADMMIMQDEIFGPLLPIKPYDNIEDVIEYINANERPLALYLYSNKKALQQQVIYNTLSGGMCINDSVVHVAQHDMPFGGVGNSGMGHYHGHEGFIEFSKMRPIFKQGPISGLLMMAPPYGATFDKMYKLMLKFKL